MDLPAVVVASRLACGLSSVWPVEGTVVLDVSRNTPHSPFASRCDNDKDPETTLDPMIEGYRSGTSMGWSLFEYLADHPDEARMFDRRMTSFSPEEIPQIVEAYDFSGARTVVDVFGGEGSVDVGGSRNVSGASRSDLRPAPCRGRRRAGVA